MTTKFRVSFFGLLFFSVFTGTRSLVLELSGLTRPTLLPHSSLSFLSFRSHSYQSCLARNSSLFPFLNFLYSQLVMST